jgi:hypothetical protein
MGNIKKLAEMARRQGLEPILHENHPYPLSRRQMVAQGLMAGTGYVVGPSLLALVSQKAKAADCGGDPATASAPVNGMRVLAFEAAGGMNIAGSNFMVWGKGGKDDLLPANALGVLGLPATMATGNIVDTELGIPMHVNSPLLEGIRAATTPDCRAKINGFPICVTSMDDSNANPFSLSYYAFKAGALGSLANVVGTETSAHGARSAAPAESVVASVSATQVRTYEDARNLVSAATLEDLLPGRTSAILKAATGLSEQRLKMLQDKELPAQIRELVDCGYTKSSTAAAGDLSSAVDASKDTAITSALAGITYTNTRNFTITRDPNNGENQSTLALSYLLCKGYAGFATKVMGGRDYHNNPRNTTNQRDFEVGFQMGTAFQVAHLTGKSLVEILYTDGGVGCSDPNTPDTGSTATSPGGGQAMFTGDRGEGGTIIVMAYHPAGRPPMANSRQQVNAFNSNGGVDQNYAEGKVVANSVTNAVQCALLNILALHGKLGVAVKVLGQSHPFREASVQENYVMFGPWPA